MLFSTIEDFMWFKVALVRPPRPDAGPGSGQGMSMLAQGASAKPLCKTCLQRVLAIPRRGQCCLMLQLSC